MAHRALLALRSSTLRVTGAAISAALVASFAAPRHHVFAAAEVEPAASAATHSAGPSILMSALDAELKRAMSSLGKGDDKEPKPYFLSYAVSDGIAASISAQYGAITSSNLVHRRMVDVQVRLGSPEEDNTHGDHRNSALTTMPLPLSDDSEAITRSLWYATNRGYAKALDGYLKVKTEQQVRAKEEDTSADFSTEKPVDAKILPGPALALDRAPWEQRVREVSAVFSKYPDVFADMVQFQVTDETDYLVSSEGTHTSNPGHVARLVVMARTRAADGMDLFRAETFEADSPAHLPDQKAVLEKTTEMAKSRTAATPRPRPSCSSSPSAGHAGRQGRRTSRRWWRARGRPFQARGPLSA